jgi:glutathione S-transferase
MAAGSPVMPHTLISHTLCPYVQRAAIVLAEKGVPFERRWVDLSNKPAWFTAVSPLGKTPVLLVGDEPVFESAVICEYLDETIAPRLHAPDALVRARERGWVEFGSAVLQAIAALYNAPDEAALQAKAADLRARFVQLEAALGAGPWFAGERFGLVDAAFGPVFRYFDVFDAIGDLGCLRGLPKLNAWRAALAARASVRDAVAAGYPQALRAFLLARGSALSARLAAQAAKGH